jgi:hypothetical protein
VPEKCRSKFPPDICERFAEHLKASGQGITNPAGYGKSIHKTGDDDARIEVWLQEPDTLPAAEQEDGPREEAWHERIAREISTIGKQPFDVIRERLGFEVTGADYDALCTAWELEPDSRDSLRAKLLEYGVSERLVNHLCGQPGLDAHPAEEVT